MALPFLYPGLFIMSPPSFLFCFFSLASFFFLSKYAFAAKPAPATPKAILPILVLLSASLAPAKAILLLLNSFGSSPVLKPFNCLIASIEVGVPVFLLIKPFSTFFILSLKS